MPERDPSMAEAPMLEVRDLTVNRQGKPVLVGVTFVLERGTVQGLVGPNGSGKSTLLHALTGLIHHEGDVRRGGEVAMMGSQAGYHPARRLGDHLRVVSRQPGIDRRQTPCTVEPPRPSAVPSRRP